MKYSNVIRMNILPLTILLFFWATLAFGSPVSEDVPISIECRVMAELAKDANIVEIAKSSQKEVVIDGQLKALWQPVAEDSKSMILDNNSIVTRRSDSNQLQTLVLVGPDDIVPTDVKQFGFGRSENNVILAVVLNNIGSDKMYNLSRNNRNKYIAEIIDGEIYNIFRSTHTIGDVFGIPSRGGQKVPELISKLEYELSPFRKILRELAGILLIKTIMLCCALFFLLKFFYLTGSTKRNLIITAAVIGLIVFIIHPQRAHEDNFRMYLVTIDYIKGFCGLIGGAIIGFILVNIFDKKLKNKNT